jgi:hypothetical protein
LLCGQILKFRNAKRRIASRNLIRAMRSVGHFWVLAPTALAVSLRTTLVATRWSGFWLQKRPVAFTSRLGARSTATTTTSAPTTTARAGRIKNRTGTALICRRGRVTVGNTRRFIKRVRRHGSLGQRLLEGLRALCKMEGPYGLQLRSRCIRNALDARKETRRRRVRHCETR